MSGSHLCVTHRMQKAQYIMLTTTHFVHFYTFSTGCLNQKVCMDGQLGYRRGCPLSEEWAIALLDDEGRLLGR